VLSAEGRADRGLVLALRFTASGGFGSLGGSGFSKVFSASSMDNAE
jgi:hypothetical protein